MRIKFDVSIKMKQIRQQDNVSYENKDWVCSPPNVQW